MQYLPLKIVKSYLRKKHKIPMENIDNLSDRNLLKQFSVYCSEDGIAGNGALMRLAPVPLFFYRFPNYAIEYSGQSGRITHGDRDVYHACRYYGALIVSALYNCKKDELLHRDFFSKNIDWFDQTKLSPNIDVISQGSFKKPGGYDEGIRGRGYIVNALEAALWAFWSDEGSFAKGALNAVNLGNDTDTTAAIYGQLAGAYYGYKKLPAYWVEHLYAKDFLLNISQWIAYESQHWQPDVN